MKSCQVFFKDDLAFVFTQSVTASGLGMSCDPKFRVKANDRAELGDAVMKCLAASQEGVADPEDFALYAKTMVQFAGEKSWGRLAKNTILREVWLEAPAVRIVPFVAGVQGSFDERADQSVQCPHVSLEIARCLLESIAGPKS